MFPLVPTRETFILSGNKMVVINGGSTVDYLAIK